MGYVGTRLPDEKRKECDELATKRGLNLSNFVRSVLYAELEREKGKE